MKHSRASIKYMLVASVVCLMCVNAGMAQSCGTWTRVADGPGPIAGQPAAYHASKGYTIIYDVVPGCSVQHTWAWDGAQWLFLGASEWGCLSFGGLGYDERRDVTVLHGGSGGTFVSTDTLEWNGVKWEFATTFVPPARAFHSIVYDAAIERMVLYGGINSDGDVVYDDTWTWDGIDEWQQVHPMTTPGGRTSHGMAYDALRGETILFGGGNFGGLSEDTWAYDGLTWSKKAVAGPSPRGSHRMAYDSWRGLVMVFAGSANNEPLNDLWEWDGMEWTEVPIPKALRPPERRAFAMAFDSKRGVLFIYGGQDKNNNVLSDAWEYTPCYPDCDRDCDLDVFDYLCFLDRFAEGSPYADFERDGDNDIFDFLAFLDEFVKGCG